MAETTYRVVVDYSLETGGVKNQVSELTQLFERLKSTIELALGGLTFKKMVEEVIELGSEAENARIRLAGMMQAAAAPGADNFNDALRLSTALIDIIREKSVALPGTWQDLATIVQRNMVFGLNTGLSAMGVTDMAAKMQALFGGQHASTQISHSLQAMLSGHVRGMDPIFQQLNAVMKPSLLNDVKGFNALGNVERREEIEKALAKQQDAINALGDTWTARSTTIRNDLELIYLAGTRPVFQFFKDTLKGLHEWLQEHKVTLEGYVNLFSRAFVAIGHAILFIFKAVGPYVTDFLEGIIKPFVPLALGLSYAFSLVADALGFVAEKGEGLRPFVVLVGNLIGLWLIWKTTVLAVTVLLEGFQAIMGFLAATNPFLPYVIAIAAIAAALIVALAYMNELRNAFEEMIDTKASRWFLKKAGIIPENATDEDINEAMSSRARERGGQSVFGQFNDPKKHLQTLFSKEGALGGIGEFFGKINFPAQNKGIAEDILNALKTPGTVKNGHTNVNVKIEQTVKTDEDPERIRILTKQGIADALEQALHHPVESPGSYFSVLRY